MAHNIGYAHWLNHREESGPHEYPDGFVFWLCLAAVYVIGALIATTWAFEKTSRHEPAESYILPPCLNRRYLRLPLVFVWPGLVWPIFLVYACLRQRRDQRRANAIFQDNGSNGINLPNVRNNRNNEGTAPPSPPPYQSVDQDHHGPEEGGE